MDELRGVLGQPLVCLGHVLILDLREVETILIMLREEHGVLGRHCLLGIVSRSHVLVDVRRGASLVQVLCLLGRRQRA